MTTEARNKLNQQQGSRWEWLLWAIDTADSHSLVARHKFRVEGYLLGLRDAGVLNEAEYTELFEQATAREMAAANRTAPVRTSA
ncbi:hypothetical protein [Pseudomonas sp.]|uniref:hypothetical protein n=1 Tax=Pseudomonas sp. TaxID=306 RepID=UPI002907EE79|nr:hypothetical protein [Pseudomonas sp.]MDU4254528.1 hypothetical protein [Pseudomonas sp.]